MPAHYSVAVIAGDGIGPEIVPRAIEVVDRAAGTHGFTVDWTPYPWGSDHYREHGSMMPADALDQLRPYDALFFGAVGAPDVPDTVTLWGLLIPIRRAFDQYVNLRPVRHIEGVPSPLVRPDGIDLVVVRENSEGEYSDTGSRENRGAPDEYAVQETRFTRHGVERIARYAADLAQRRSGRLASATKSNGILHTMPYWDEVVAETAAGYPDVRLTPMLIDALAAALVLRPQDFDVIVGSNLFGDILSDLTAALVGSLGLAPSANLNPERAYPSLFEPVHGSAPDIAGQGVANPMAQIYSAAMMLDHLGQPAAAAAVTAAVDAVLRAGVRPRDLGGTAGTVEVTQAVLDRLDPSRA